jgi:hypothetical protein
MVIPAQIRRILKESDGTVNGDRAKRDEADDTWQ